ncbi:MAG: carboxypeptidase-like regulatory domain-containing protein [Blastocatellia bacterium]
MSSFKPDRLQVISPCAEAWDKMRGNEQKRWCDACHKHVHDFSQMSAREIEALLRVRQGNVCGRITRDENGRMVTRETQARLAPMEFVRLQPPPRRASVAPRLMLSAVLSLTPVGALHTAVPAQDPGAVSHDARDGKRRADPAAGTGDLSGVAMDPFEAVIPHVSVTLTEVATEQTRETKTDVEGRWKFQGLAAGEYTVTFHAPGFKTAVYTEVVVGAGQNVKLEARMDVGQVTMGGAIVQRSPTLIELYENSDLVSEAHVLTAGVRKPQNAVTAALTDTEDLAETTLALNLVHKGNAVLPVVHVYEQLGQRERSEFRPGETVLVFLKRQEESEEARVRDGYIVTDSLGGIKRLNIAQMAAYRNHLPQLKTVFADGRAQIPELAEWLTQLTEDRATRTEGASALGGSLRKMRTELASAADIRKHVAECRTPKCTEPHDPGAEVTPALLRARALAENDASLVASVLSDAQKQRLTNALYQADPITGDDHGLLRIAAEWEGARLVPWLVRQLRGMSESADPMASELIRVIADQSNHETLRRLASEFEENARYDDLFAQAEAQQKAEALASGAEAEEEDEDDAETLKEKGQKQIEANAGRKAMIRQFLQTAEILLAQPRPGK